MRETRAADGLERSGGGGRRPRVAVLWAGLSGYLHACLQALVVEGVDVVVVHRRPEGTAPFDPTAISSGLRAETWDESPDAERVTRMLESVEPDAILVCSWHIGPYRRVARRFRGRTLRIMSLPNQWLATTKQWGGVLLSPFVLRPAYDAAFVSGDRQAEFADKLGFTSDRLIWGMNTCDQPLYSALADGRGDAVPPERFLFAGRLVPDKAIDVLAEGYERYRSRVEQPWPLMVAGVGPDEHLLRGREGIELQGFVQPADLPDLVRRAGCLVLPSRFEPWGVVIHEATSAGLPVICSRACGASTRLLLDGYNGYVISPDDSDILADALAKLHHLSGDERRAMGAAGRGLAAQFTPRRWAQGLLSRIPELRGRIGLDPFPWEADVSADTGPG